MAQSNKLHYILNIPIAHLICQLRIDNYDYSKRLKKRFYSVPLSNNIQPSFIVQVERRNISNCIFDDRFPHKHGICPYPMIKSNFDKYAFSLITFIQQFVIPHNIIFLHASSFIKNHRAYVFCGPSGVGKSTIIKKVPEQDILSDDTAVLRMIGNKFYVYQSPFNCLKYPYYLQQKIPLAEIFFLKKAKITKIVVLNLIDSLDKLFYNTDIIYHRIICHRKKRSYPPSALISKEKKEFKSVFNSLYKLVFDLVLYSKPKQLYTPKQFIFLSEL